MTEFVTLSCPSCGAKLQIGNDIETFACNHCGNEHIVKRIGGIVSLAPVVEQLKKVNQGVDKTASELAIQRIQKEIALLNEKAKIEKREHQANYDGRRVYRIDFTNQRKI